MKHKFSIRAIIYLCFSVFLLSNTTLRALTVNAESSDNKVILIDKAQQLQILEDKDLFDNMKNTMPGDTKSETVLVENRINQSVTFYLYATVDSLELDNPEIVFGKNYMTELMKQVHLTVYNKTTSTFIYKGPATGNPADKIGNQEIYGSMVQNVDGNGGYGVLLGTLSGNSSMDLEVTITLPGASMDNSYQDSFGYVNWVFVSEGDDPTPTDVPTQNPTPTDRPTQTPTPTTLTPGTPTPTPEGTPTVTPIQTPIPTPTEGQPTPTETPSMTPTPDGSDEGTPTPTDVTIDEDDDEGKPVISEGNDLPKTGGGVTYIKPLLSILVVLGFGLFLLDRVHKKKIKE